MCRIVKVAKSSSSFLGFSDSSPVMSPSVLSVSSCSCVASLQVIPLELQLIEVELEMRLVSSGEWMVETLVGTTSPCRTWFWFSCAIVRVHRTFRY